MANLRKIAANRIGTAIIAIVMPWNTGGLAGSGIRACKVTAVIEVLRLRQQIACAIIGLNQHWPVGDVGIQVCLVLEMKIRVMSALQQSPRIACPPIVNALLNRILPSDSPDA